MTLDEFLTSTDQTNEQFAEKIGTSGEAVRLYRKHERMPREEIMPLIVEATGRKVMPNDFYGFPCFCAGIGGAAQPVFFNKSDNYLNEKEKSNSPTVLRGG